MQAPSGEQPPTVQVAQASAGAPEMADAWSGCAIPSTFESNPSKSVADFTSKECVGLPTSAATSELEAKLRQRMLKCEGKDILYKPQVAKSMEKSPSRAPARLKQTILRKNDEEREPPRVDNLAEIQLVDELVVTASYQRCTKARAQSAHSLTRAQRKALGGLGGPREKRPHSHNEARETQYHREEALQDPHSPFAVCSTGRPFPRSIMPSAAASAAPPRLDVRRAEREKETPRPLVPATPPSEALGTPLSCESASGASDFNSAASQDEFFESTEGVPVVATFALDDPTRDAMEETGVDDGSARVLDTEKHEDPESPTHPDDISIEECLLDLVNHVPPGLAQKLGLVLQKLEEAKRTGAPEQAPGPCSDVAPAAAAPGPDMEAEGPRTDPEPELPSACHVEAERPEEGAGAAPETLREAEQLATEVARERLLEESQCAAEARAEAEDARELAEAEVLRAMLVAEQAEILGMREHLEEAEQACECLEEESRGTQAELSGFRHEVADLDAHLETLELHSEQCLEETARCRSAEAELEGEARAASELGMELEEQLRAELASALAAEASRAEPELPGELSSAGQRLQEDEERQEAALLMEEQQAESAQASHAAELERLENLEFASRLMERELRAELERVLAEAEHLRLRAEAAEQLREEGAFQAEEISSELHCVSAERDSLHCNIESELELLLQERARGELLNGRNQQLRESHERFRAQLEEQLMFEVQHASTAIQSQEEIQTRERLGEQLLAELEVGRATFTAEVEEVEEARARIEAVAGQTDTYTAEAESLRGRLEEINARLRQEKDQESRFRHELTDAAGEREVLKTELAAKRSKVMEERSRRSAADAEIQRLAAERETLCARLAAAASERAACNTKRAELEEDLAGLQRMVLAAREEREEREERRAHCPGLGLDVEDWLPHEAYPDAADFPLEAWLGAVWGGMDGAAGRGGRARPARGSAAERTELSDHSRRIAELQEVCQAVDLQVAAQARSLERRLSLRHHAFCRAKTAVAEAEELRVVMDAHSVTERAELQASEAHHQMLQAETSLIAVEVAALNRSSGRHFEDSLRGSQQTASVHELLCEALHNAEAPVVLPDRPLSLEEERQAGGCQGYLVNLYAKWLRRGRLRHHMLDCGLVGRQPGQKPREASGARSPGDFPDPHMLRALAAADLRA